MSRLFHWPPSWWPWPRPRPPVPPSPPIPPPSGDMVQQLLALHNAERAKQSLPPYRLSAVLCQVAQAHSEWMHNTGIHSHEEGRFTPFDRMRSAGYMFSAAAENIADGQISPEQAVSDWMNSPPHRRAILGPYVEVGFGVAGTDWTSDFGTPMRSAIGASETIQLSGPLTAES